MFVGCVSGIFQSEKTFAEWNIHLKIFCFYDWKQRQLKIPWRQQLNINFESWTWNTQYRGRSTISRMKKSNSSITHDRGNYICASCGAWIITFQDYHQSVWSSRGPQSTHSSIKDIQCEANNFEYYQFNSFNRKWTVNCTWSEKPDQLLRDWQTILSKYIL